MTENPWIPWKKYWKFFEKNKREDMIDISSGANLLPMPCILKEVLIDDINNNNYIYYGPSRGSPLSREAILFYENSHGINKCLKDNNISLTFGATSAIEILFQYIKQHLNGDVLLLGLNYYIFADCCLRNNIKVFECISGEDGRTLPIPLEYEKSLLRNKNIVIAVLTLPSNPSGEMYTENEFMEILQVSKKYGIKLLIDKIYMDETSITNSYLDVIKILLNNKYFENSFIVDGFSKKRSIVSPRIGYIIGKEDLIDFFELKNTHYILTPGSLATSLIVLDSIFKTFLYMERNDKLSDLNPTIFKFRKLLSNEYQINLTYNLFFKGYNKYISYKRDLTNNYNIIRNNIKIFADILKPYIKSLIYPSQGFNFIVKFRLKPEMKSEDFIKNLFEETGVALISEECFTLQTSSKNNFWIRVSAALNNNEFLRGTKK